MAEENSESFESFSTATSDSSHEGLNGKPNSEGFIYPAQSDMNEEMRVEAMELCVTACEKFSNNNETAAKLIKETMDKKFGASWHVVVGEGFGFEITHEVKNLLYMFFGGSQAIILWKCS